MNNKGKRLNRVILRGDVYWNWENENGIVRPIPKIIDDNNKSFAFIVISYSYTFIILLG